MGVFTGALMTIMVWWIVFLISLPFGGASKGPKTLGQAASAPDRTCMRIKMMVSTVLTAILVAILYILVKNKWIQLDNWE